jgi:hypothetical protein
MMDFGYFQCLPYGEHIKTGTFPDYLFSGSKTGTALAYIEAESEKRKV